MTTPRRSPWFAKLGGLILALACAGGAAACNKDSGGDPDVDKVVQAVAAGKKVSVTVHIEGRPGEAKKDHKVVVEKVDFDDSGQLKTVYFNDRGAEDKIPAAGFRKVLVRNAPITVE